MHLTEGELALILSRRRPRREINVNAWLRKHLSVPAGTRVWSFEYGDHVLSVRAEYTKAVEAAIGVFETIGPVDVGAIKLLASPHKHGDEAKLHRWSE